MAGNGAIVKRGRGQPTKFNADRAKRFVEMLAKGNFIHTAASIVGISYTTAKSWRRRGWSDAQAGLQTELATFLADCTRAISDSEARALDKIRQAGEGVEQRRIRKITKPVLVNGRPVLIRDGKGNPVLTHDGRPQYEEHVETVVEVHHDFDWRADAFFLQTRHMSKYGRHRLDVAAKLSHKHVHTFEMSAEDEEIATRIATRRLEPLLEE